MSIRLAGDWAPGMVNVKSLEWSDLAIINLEGPVFRNPSGINQIPKAGPHLWNASLPKGIHAIAFTLGNNHIMDYGEVGLAMTVDRIHSSHGHFCGAGANLSDSRKPLIIHHEGLQIGILSRCETQFGTASLNKAGTCPVDSTIYQAIRDLKSGCDLIIVSLHAAAEMSPWPSPSRQDLCRSLIDSGADIIHGHHSHIPQGWEQYNGGFIFYGLGNLCVDPSRWLATSNALWSISPRMNFSKSELQIEFKTSTIKNVDLNSIAITDPSSDEREAHGQYIEVCNQPLANRELLEGLWQEVSIDLYRKHFGPWLGQMKTNDPPYQGNDSMLRRLASKAKQSISQQITKQVSQAGMNADPYQQRLWYHLFACESHSSAISTALGVMSGVIEDLRSPRTAQMKTSMIPN